MISIIVPVLNEAARISDLLSSLRPLIRAGHEVLVIDGGSNDGTRELVRAAGLLPLESARGRAEQMNCGARHAKGDVLLFLHADSFPSPDWCEAVLSLDGQSGWGFFRPGLRGSHVLLPLISWFMWQRSCLSGIATGDMGIWCSAIFRDHAGSVFPDQPLMEDIEFSARMKRLGRPRKIDVVLETSARRWETNGVFRTVLSMWWFRLRYFLGVDAQSLYREYYGC